MIKKQSGVTLIALIVTIIVVLLLSSLTLNYVFGENGILVATKQAKKESEDSLQKDEKEMNTLYEEFDNMLQTHQEKY